MRGAHCVQPPVRRSGQDPLGSSSSSSSNRSSISTKQQRERPSSSSSSNGGPGPHEQQPQQQQQQQQQQQDGPALDSLLLTALASEASDEQQAAADSKAAGAAGWAATLGVVAGVYAALTRCRRVSVRACHGWCPTPCMCVHSVGMLQATQCGHSTCTTPMHGTPQHTHTHTHCPRATRHQASAS
jgi:hypothetical protein